MPTKKKENQAITTMIPVGLSFAEGSNGFELQILRPGKWDHPSYGMVEVTEEIQQEFVDNFDKDLRAHSSTIGLPIDEEHYSDRGAVGWIKKLVNKGSDGLFATVEWNNRGKQKIKDAIYRFFSPEFYFKYEDPEDRRLYNNVLIGGALTNRPYFKGLNPVVLSENIIIKNMNLKEIVAKNFSDLNDQEKKFVKEHFNELSEDNKKKFEGVNEKKDDTFAMSEKKIMMSESDVAKLREDAELGRKAKEELSKKEMNEKITGFIYSESNKDGKLPATVKDKVVDFAMSLSADQSVKFFEIVNSLPTVKMFAELGDSIFGDGNNEVAPKGVDTYSFNLDKKAKELQANDKSLSYNDALIKAEKELKNK